MKAINDFYKMKKDKIPISMITGYDYFSAKLIEKSELDVILVGDSLGMVVLGYENTLQVTLDDIIHHTKAVRRGAKDTFIIADLPYMTYHLSSYETKKNAFSLIQKGKANAIKLEGGSPSRLQAIREIVDCEIPVCAHLGLTPQSVNKFGGYKVQGKTEKAYEELINQAKQIEEAGAFMLVLEGIPESLGKEITESIKIPTVGIGAGRFTDGQVMVFHDILGLADFKPKFVKIYDDISIKIEDALKNYKIDVINHSFPSKNNVYYPINNDE